MTSTRQRFDAEPLLRDFFSGKNESEMVFLTEFLPRFIKSIINRHFPGAGDYYTQEIIAESITSLLVTRSKKSPPAIQNVSSFLVGIVRNAIQKVKSDNRPFGQRSRELKNSSNLNLDEVVISTTDNVQIESRIDSEKVFSLAQGALKQALILEYKEGTTETDAANAVGMGRNKFRREKKKFFLSFRRKE